MHNYHEIISLHGVSLTGFFTKNAFHGGRGGSGRKNFFRNIFRRGILHGGGTNGQIHAK